MKEASQSTLRDRCFHWLSASLHLADLDGGPGSQEIAANIKGRKTVTRSAFHGRTSPTIDLPRRELLTGREDVRTPNLSENSYPAFTPTKGRGAAAHS